MKKIYLLSIFLFLLFVASLYFLTVASFADENQSSGNSCSSTQSGKNNNNNCNQQNQNEHQDQTQNNNQSVNITLNQPPMPQIYAVAQTVQLPSTGTPFAVWGILTGVTSLGILLRRITKK